MKLVGLLGGMSPESTAVYYRLANRWAAEQLGPLHSARLLLHSVDFAEVELRMREGRWNELGALLGDAAVGLERAGAELVLLCSNSPHRIAEQIEERLGIPFLHIADVTARAILATPVRRIGFLATRFAMDQPFLRERLERQGVEAMLPDLADRERLHRIIFEELVQGKVEESSRQALRAMSRELIRRGAGGIVLACTELQMLLSPGDLEVPLFDTTTLHVEEAMRLALVGR